MDDPKITFTYLNIRQSIVILLSKLIATDLLFASITITAYFLLMIGSEYGLNSQTTPYYFFVIFIFLGLIKLSLSSYIVLQWLNEYYEITPEYIYHKKGIIFRTKEQYRIAQIRRVQVEDTFFGQLFNFATISIFDQRLNKTLDLYLIHNPNRYLAILKELNPEIEKEKDQINLPFLPPDED